MRNFQREGAISNAHVGRDFEALAQKVLARHGIDTQACFIVPIGITSHKKDHKFDLGSVKPKLIVECKSHRWTKGDNVPSAKLIAWNEAMYYFAIAPHDYRKILFVLKAARASNGETLAEYYMRTHQHLIPPGVEIWEYDEEVAELSVFPHNTNPV